MYSRIRSELRWIMDKHMELNKAKNRVIDVNTIH